MLLDGSREDFYPTRIPMPAWKAILALNAALARAGRSLGYDEGRPGRVRGRADSLVAGARGGRAGLLAAGTLAALVLALRRRGGYRVALRR